MGDPSLTLDNAFWAFSLRVHDRPGVAGALVTLQDTLSVDVDVVLFAVFVALRRSEMVSAADVVRWDDAVRTWQGEVVEPLRGVRRRLKTDPTAVALRADVAAVELRAEQYEQAMLFATLTSDVVQRPADPRAAILSALTASSPCAIQTH
ncbi:MAG TPA: TIGR02444 family protein [Candidatus Binatia bacterium]|jgi:uncharacterized protein (TIGR02444 family)|nr:TIGR02444 family protein [Candidatus Binatia bacterium]